MKPLLAIDVGTGTQDILIFDPEQRVENCTKLVLPSPTRVMAGRIALATREGQALGLDGRIMGGGPLVGALRRHLAAGLAVYATPEAGKTIRDNLDEVREMGIQIVDALPGGIRVLYLTDFDRPALACALAPFGVELPGQVAIAVQDHGESLAGSNREARFTFWRDFVGRDGDLKALLYAEAPSIFTRMRAVQAEAPGALVMDTGPAAVWGALSDPEVARHAQTGLTVLNVGNGHTIAFTIQGDRVHGLFEHHTGALSHSRLSELVHQLQSGTISHEEVFGEGGHGAYVNPERPAADFGFVAITGPNRRLARGLGYFAVPGGDMMLSGCFGLIAAAARQAGEPNPFLI